MGCCGKSEDDDERAHGNTRIAPEKGSKDPAVDDKFDGPLKKRGCTDILCLLMLLAALGGAGYVFFLAYAIGDPYRLLNGYDSYGNTCGRENTNITNATLSGRDMSDLKRLFYFNPLALFDQTGLISSEQLCIKDCPDQEAIISLTSLKTYAENTSIKLCRYDVEVADYPSAPSGSCPNLPVTAHIDILNRCIPKALSTIASALTDTVSSMLTSSLGQSTCDSTGDFFQKIASDVASSYMDIIYLSGIAIVSAFLIIVLMRFIAPIIIWGCVAICALGSLAGCGYIWYKWYGYNETLKNYSVNSTSNSSIAIEEIQLSQYEKDEKNWEIYAIIASIGAGIVLLLLLILRKRIALVVQLFREASKAVASMPFLLIQPFWTLICLMIFLGGASFGFMWVLSAGDPVVDADGKVEFKTNETLFYLKWYYVFVMLWIMEFVFACHQMTVAGSVASWYFTRDKSTLKLPIASSIWRLLRYHLGSVAFGSCILAIIKLVRLILAYIQRKLAGRAGPFVDFLLKCLQCCLWCFEKFIKFLNKNAYIMIAIYGYSFCKGAFKGFSLLVSNCLRVAAINSVGTFVLFLGKAGVVTINIVIGMEFFFKQDNLCYFWFPLALAGIVSFLIAHTFISIYGLTIDTIFLCFCEDSERNDGISKPYFMSKGLMEFVSNSSKALKVEEQRAKERHDAPSSDKKIQKELAMEAED